MAPSSNVWGIVADPIAALREAGKGSVMAVITGVEGPSYRPVGAIMAIGPMGERVGTLSSGCIEGDLVNHATDAKETGRPVALRYGQGSPFVDIQLPCGGGLDILLVPDPDPGVLDALAARRFDRSPCTLRINRKNGEIALGDAKDAATDDFEVAFQPDIRFVVFGKGPEALAFAALAHSVGYEAILYSPDPETRDMAEASRNTVRDLKRGTFPADAAIDKWTAVTVFFHDHEWEPPILAPALASDAFYVGAQGSRRTAMARLLELEELGVSPDNLARLKGPVGLVASARDARTLAISVLAEVMDVAKG